MKLVFLTYSLNPLSGCQSWLWPQDRLTGYSEWQGMRGSQGYYVLFLVGPDCRTKGVLFHLLRDLNVFDRKPDTSSLLRAFYVQRWQSWTEVPTLMFKICSDSLISKAQHAQGRDLQKGFVLQGWTASKMLFFSNNPTQSRDVLLSFLVG